MRLKPKTVRRLILLTVVVVLVAVSAIGLVVVRQWNGERMLEERRAEGFEAFEKRDYARAMDRLGPYLSKRGEDAEAYIRYARARWRTEEADGGHAVQAISVYRRYRGLRPDDLEAGVELLHIYNVVGGRQVEARDLALSLRPPNVKEAGPEHVPVLREEATALRGSRDTDERKRLGEVVERLCELTPLDLDARLARFQWLRDNDRASEATDLVREFRDAYPDDPRSAIFELITRDDAGAPVTPEELARSVGLDPTEPEASTTTRLPDEATALGVVLLFDRLGRYDLSRAVLRTASDPIAWPSVFRLRVRRAWTDGAMGEVLAATDGADAASPDWVPEVVGFRAVALFATDRDAEARPLCEVLIARRGDFRSAPWGRVAEHVARPDRAPVAAAGALAEVVKIHPLEPVFHFAHAEALLALGRTEEAVTEYRRAVLPEESPLTAGWAQPWIRLAHTYLQMGLVTEAEQAAQRASRAAPGNVAAAMTRLNTLLAGIERAPGPTGDEGQLLDLIDRALAEVATHADPSVPAALADELLPGRVLLLSRLGRASEAEALVRDRLASAGAPPARKTLERIALVSLREGLSVSSAALGRAVEAHGPAPSTAAIQAQSLHASGRTSEAVALLRAGAASAPPADRRDWDCALAVFLDQGGDPAAPRVWEELAGSYPDDPHVQELILRSRGAADVPGLLDRAQKRLVELTGVDAARSSVLRLARARSLLTGRPDVAQREEAMGLLRQLVTDQPQMLEAHLLLADALLLADPDRGIDPDPGAAITALRDAAAIATAAAPISLRIAELLQIQRDFAGARTELSRLARDPGVNPAVRRRAGELLAAQGLPGEAIPVFEAIAAEGGEADRLALAKLYALARRDSEALAMFRTIAEEATDPDRVAVVVVWLDRLGDAPASDRLAERLGAMVPDAVRREMMLGECDAGRRRWASAAARFRAAASADPASVEAWVRCIDAQLQAGDANAAAGTAGEASQRHPQDGRIAVATERVAAAQAGESPDLAALAAALAADPGQTAARAVVIAVDEARRAGALDREDGLAALADRYPENWPVQSLVIGRLMSLLPPRAERATRLVDRALDSFPASPEPARLAFRVYGATESWERALAVAQEWQRRDATRSMEPLAAVAEARIQLGRHVGAWEALRESVEPAQRNADSSESALVLGMAARALLAGGRAEEAWAVLAPALQRSASVRTRVLIPLIAEGYVPADQVERWIERADPLFPTEDAIGRVGLARACTARAAQDPERREALLARSGALLAPLRRPGGGANPTALVAQADLERARGELSAARDSCLLALEADPSSLAAIEVLARTVANDEEGRRILSEAAARYTARAKDPGAWLVVGRALHAAAAEGLPPADAAPLLRGALDAYRSALTVAPQQPEALVQGADLAARLGDDRTALEFYDAALALSELPANLRCAVQNNAAYFLATRPNPAPESLRRALALARGAVETAPIPSFLDTLARVHLALGARSDAILAYRRALAAEPGHAECLLGLIEILAAGAPSEQDEARRLLRRITGEGGVPLNAQQSERAARVRAILGE